MGGKGSKQGVGAKGGGKAKGPKTHSQQELVRQAYFPEHFVKKSELGSPGIFSELTSARCYDSVCVLG